MRKGKIRQQWRIFCALWSLWFGILVTERWLVSVVEPSRSAPTKRNVMEPKRKEKCEIEFISGHGKKMIGDAVGANNYSPLQNIWKYLILRVFLQSRCVYQCRNSLQQKSAIEKSRFCFIVVL
ncbi:MAG: hypothetical protein J6K01_09515 [Paludibacteraceae bacterium]|nr:hypothetical protein [Paludibacteraceae bacterium]